MSPEHYERVLDATFPEKAELGRFDLVEAGDNLLTPDWPEDDPILCDCPCGCSSAVPLPAFEGDRCPMCSEACGP